MTPITIFVASPGDVAAERKSVGEVAARLNGHMARERKVYFDVRAYETETRHRMHPDGAQAAINIDMPVQKHDIVIGIFWKRFGTPIKELDKQTGTEYELRRALANQKGDPLRPEVAVFFSDAAVKPSEADGKQLNKVKAFRKKLKGLPIAYDGPVDFKDKLREYLSQYLRDHYPVTNEVTGDPSGYVESLRVETAEIEVQQVKVGGDSAWILPIAEFYIPLSSASKPLAEETEAHRTLLITGDPGSGKSTFLKWLANRLCLEHQKSGGGPLPVPITIAALAGHIAKKHEAETPTEDHSPDWLIHCAAARCRENSHGLSADYFRKQAKQGHCVFLLDGLDETPDQSSREKIVRLVSGAAKLYKDCRFVVTTRIEGKLAIPGFEERRIADLSSAQVTDFVEKLARHLYPADAARAAAFREELERANTSRPIRRLARNPVMLTALAVLQHSNIRLPERRVDLYAAVIEWLASRRADSALKDQRLFRFRELALAMQQAEGGRKKRVTLTWAAEQLVAKFDGEREAAEKFLKEQQVKSGIVVSRGHELEFWHLTFQEYLAAREIAAKLEGGQKKLLLDSGAIWKPEWREVALLYAGLLRGQGGDKIDALMKLLLDTMGAKPSLADRARVVGLIGAMLRDLDGYRPGDARYEESLRLVEAIFDREKSRSVPFADRLAAAEALNRVDPGWVEIPETKGFLMGAQGKDRKKPNFDEEASDNERVRKVDLIPAFRIGKYPVTVAEYEQFMDDGGYADRGLWEAGGFGETSEPERWLDQIDFKSRPVAGVNWWEAMAYAKWADARLPSEEEWERAARGTQGRKYPWGETIDTNRANYDESGIGRPTPVGLYPDGASEEGVLDLAGNVWEWTTSPHEALEGAFVCRGGSWSNGSWGARSACRGHLRPVARSDYLGFRLVQGIT